MKKKDLILIGILLAVALFGWGGIQLSRYLKMREAAQPSKTIEQTQKPSSETAEGEPETETTAAENTAEPEFGVLISVNGEEFGRYFLAEDQVININGKNTFVIKDGVAWMAGADCPDHLCMFMDPIDGLYDLIVCLPNMVIAEGIIMEGNSAGPEIDGVS